MNPDENILEKQKLLIMRDFPPLSQYFQKCLHEEKGFFFVYNSESKMRRIVWWFRSINDYQEA